MPQCFACHRVKFLLSLEAPLICDDCLNLAQQHSLADYFNDGKLTIAQWASRIVFGEREPRGRRWWCW